MATERGTFPIYDHELEANNPFLAELKDYELMKQHGRRNISILTNAPTGSVAILAQVNSGIEPFFRLDYTRRKKINHGDNTTVPDFTDHLGDKWSEFKVYDHCYLEYGAWCLYNKKTYSRNIS